ncbi:MAG: hypothetical protein V4671_09880 [Armatimonadota bacterium]
MPHSFLPYKKPLLAGALLCIVLVVFYPCVTSFFHSDDLDQLWFVSKDGPLGIWKNTPQDYFRPLVSISLWAEWKIWGLNPSGYHVTHCLLHIVNCLLLYFLGRRLAFSETASAIASLLFLVLPGHSEAVAWIGDRAGLWATFFTLVSLNSFFAARRGSRQGEVVLVIGCVLGFLAKEAAILLPAFLAVFNAMRPGTDGSPLKRRGIRWVFGLLLLIPLYFLARWFYVGSLLGGPGGSPRISAFYIGWGLLRALPATLCPMTTSSLAFALAALVLLIGGVWVFLRAERDVRRDVLYLLLAFYVAVLPASWVSLSPPLWGYDTRVLYLPSVFACLALARLLETLRFARVIATGLFLLFAVQSFVIFQQWNKAGVWVKEGLATMASFPDCRRRIVLVAPDIRYPAYVFRRGMASGLRLFHKDAPPEIVPLALTVFYTDRDRVEITPETDGVSVALHYATPAIKRTPAMGAKTGLPLTLKTSNPPSFHLTLPKSRPGDQIIYFSEGRFRVWNP